MIFVIRDIAVLLLATTILATSVLKLIALLEIIERISGELIE